MKKNTAIIILDVLGLASIFTTMILMFVAFLSALLGKPLTIFEPNKLVLTLELIWVGIGVLYLLRIGPLVAKTNFKNVFG